jgi:alkanesulfonate monooxygenase SsuD/methylene tetrahydromethanopterin reductase-like flavin-dependent oxidoreductase (luciferase family)
VTSRELGIGRAPGGGQLEAFALRRDRQSAIPFHRRQLRRSRRKRVAPYFTGTPDKVAAKLRGLASELHLKEIIINTITHDHEARKRSYSLLADAIGLTAVQSEALFV